MRDFLPAFTRSACGAALLAASLWGCGSHGSAVPSGGGSAGGAQSASGQSVVPNAGGDGLPFEQALGKAFHSDADFAPYIDHDLVGKDRATALHLMKLMPPRMRADFVYIDSSGRLMSNRKAVAAGYRPFTYTENNDAAAAATSSGIRPMSDPPYPPPLHTGTGPYLQTYAVRGVNAFLGYVKWKCSDMTLAGDDDPHIYSGGFGQDGIDSAIDAGIKWVGGGPWSEDFVPFLAYSTTGFKYSGWVPNDTVHYSCDNNVGIMYGVLDSQYVMLMVGYPDYSPEQYTLPPAAATWHHGSWIFYQTPGAFYQPGLWQGRQTPCTSCYVKRMVSIAQTGGDYFTDGSCFGACDGNHMTIRWDQTVMGQLIQPCHGGSQSAQCTIEFYTDFPAPRWYGGFKPYPAPGGVFWNENYFNAYEGISLQSRFATASGNELAPDGTFAGSLPPEPPSCTLDGNGYCATFTGSSDDGTISCFDGLHWHDFPATRTMSYEVFGTDGYIETANAIETFSDNGDGNCPTTDWSWDPQEPSQQFGDPNLP